MKKHLIVILAIAGLTLASCTSNDSKEDLASGDGTTAEATASTDEGAAAETPPELASETMSEGDLNSATTTTTQTENPPGDAAAAVQQNSVSQENLVNPADSAAAQAAAEPPPAPAEPPAMAPDTTAKTGSEVLPVEPLVDTNPTPMEPAKAAAPLQKVTETPWQVGGKWVNAVYISRPGDSMKSISEGIYGKPDQVKTLKKMNPTVASKGKLSPGTKVYYNSPNRPEDATRVMTYQEDNGQQPEIYVAQEGDKIKAVSKKLLGYPAAWKEVWSINAVESKDTIPAGTELRYWKSGLVAKNDMPAPTEAASATPPPPPPPADMPPPPPVQAGTKDAAAPHNDMPPPPPPPDMAMNAPPPPPPPPEMAPPPPPPPAPMKKKKAADDAAVAGTDEDSLIMVAAVGIAALGLAGFFIARKKRREREAQSSFDTQVGS